LYIKSFVRLAVVAAATIFHVSAAQAADWDFTGNWQMKVSCKGFKQVNTLRISRADMKKVTGTTNVGEGFGKIVSGQFDGEHVVFINEYRWEGRKYSETWKGKLSRNGNYLRGRFDSTNKDSGGCSFSGPRL